MRNKRILPPYLALLPRSSKRLLTARIGLQKQIVAMFKHDRGEALVLSATFLLTVFEDITVGIGAGVALGSVMFMHRMAEVVEVETGADFAPPHEDEDREDNCYVPALADKVMTYRINGPFFFGVAASVSAVLDAIGPRPESFILDLTRVPLADAAAANALLSFVEKAQRRKMQVYIVGANPRVRRTLETNGVNDSVVQFAADEFSVRSKMGL